MITLPSAFSSTPSDLEPLGEGTHTVTLQAIRLVTTKSGEEKLVVEYANASGEFSDWLGFRSPKQTGRTFAYLDHLHKLAGIVPPKGKKLDEDALVAAGTSYSITLQADDRGRMEIAEFPALAAEPVGDDIPF